MDTPDPSQALTDGQIDALVTGTSVPPGHDDVAAGLDALRALGAAQPDVVVSTALAEFVSDSAGERAGGVSAMPVTAPLVPDGLRFETVPLEPVTADSAGAAMSSRGNRRHRMITGFASGIAAKAAVSGAVVLAGLTGVHAAGLVDVPLLPDKGVPVEVVLSGAGGAPAIDSPAQAATPEATAEQPTEADDAEAAGDHALSIHMGDGGVRIEMGDVSISIAVDVVNGEAAVDVEVDGVSPACEAALEELETVTDPDALADLGDLAGRIQAACGDELGDLLTAPDGLSLDFDKMFEGPGFEMFFDENFDPSQLEQFFEDFDPSQLEQFLGDFGSGSFGDSGFGMFFDENFDPSQLEQFFQDFDPSEFFGGLDGLGGIEGFDPESLDEFFQQFEELGLLDGLGDLDGFDPGSLGELGDFDDLLDQLNEFFGEPSLPPVNDGDEIGA